MTTTLPYAAVIAEESARAADALNRTDAAALVPACTDWVAADLAYHLGEVQDFWSQLVEHAPIGTEGIEETVRRPDGELVPFLQTRTAALLEAIGRRDPADPCLSWSATGGNIAWVLRRQAHEALVHRVDAEQTAGLPITVPDPQLAGDGVDEMVTVMISGIPPWSTFNPTGARIRLRAPDVEATWLLALGRFTGTSPTTGTTYDTDCAEAFPDPGGPVDAEVSAPAWNLYLWLWGRFGDDAVDRIGDKASIARLREVIADGTQ